MNILALFLEGGDWFLIIAVLLLLLFIVAPIGCGIILMRWMAHRKAKKSDPDYVGNKKFKITYTFIKRLLILSSCVVLAVVIFVPYIANKIRIAGYEDDVARTLEFKTDLWYLPDSIPENATRVYYGGGWGHTVLRFRLPKEEAIALREEFVSEYGEPSKVEFSYKYRHPSYVSEDYEELVWGYYKTNHGSAGGVWYHPDKNEFVFYHAQW